MKFLFIGFIFYLYFSKYFLMPAKSDPLSTQTFLSSTLSSKDFGIPIENCVNSCITYKYHLLTTFFFCFHFFAFTHSYFDTKKPLFILPRMPFFPHVLPFILPSNPYKSRIW